MVFKANNAADKKQTQNLGAEPGSEAIKERVVSSA